MSELTPAAVVTGFYMQYWQSLAILAAAHLGVADAVGSMPRHVDDLAGALKANPRTLLRLMRALCSRGIFREVGERSFAHSNLSEALKTGAPGGARDVIRAFGLKSTRAACTAYEDAIASGASAMDLVLGPGGAFEHRAHDPNEAHAYDAGMTAAAVSLVEPILRAFDFSRFDTLVDVGGGQGTLLASILARNPDQRGVLFDTATVIAGAGPILERHGVRDRCTVRSGDFRADLPANGDGYILKNVLHGYSDTECVDLLRRIRSRARAGAHVIIIELVMPAGTPSPVHATFDLFLLLGGMHSRVRSEPEFRELLAQADFTDVRVVPTAAPACVVDAAARP
jgi:C-methyltransferase